MILPPASWCWPLPANAIERISPWALLAEQVDRRVLHRQLRAEVAVDPLHRRVLVGDSALRDQVEDVLRPVLDRRVADPGVRLSDDLDHGRVQRVGRVDRRGAALDVVNVGAVLGDDQGALELAHVLGVDPEVGLQRHLDLDTGGHVDERAARPDRGVERRELVVVRRDDRRPVLADEVLVLAQSGVHVGEDHALGLELLVHLVVDGLALVLGADAGEELALGLGDAELVEGVLDVLGDLVPAALAAARRRGRSSGCPRSRSGRGRRPTAGSGGSRSARRP